MFDTRAEPRAVEDSLMALDELRLRLAAVVEPEVVADIVLGEGLRAFGAASGSLCLLDLDGESLEIIAAAGYSDEVMRAWTTFPLDADLPASEATRTGAAVFLHSSTDRDRRFPAFLTAPTIDEEAVACVPLRAAEGVLGALALGFVEPGDFSPEFQRDLESFCAHAATALARTTGRMQLAFLATASARLGASLDVLETLDAIGRLAVPRLADSAVVCLENGDMVEAFEVGGAHDGPMPLPDVQIAVDERTSSLLLPLRARSHVIGSLELRGVNGRVLSRTDRLLATELAARAAVAIDNAQLFREQMRERIAAQTAEGRLRQLQRVMVDLSRALDADAVADVLAHMDFPGFDIHSRGLWLVDAVHSELALVARFDDGRLPRSLLSISVDSELPAAEVLRTGEAVLVRSVAERDVRYPMLADVAPTSESFVVLPLAADDRPFGVLSFGVAGVLDENDLPFLTAVAEQCAQALARARLYEREHAAREQAVADRQRIQKLVAALQSSLLPPALPEIPGAELSARYLAGMAGLDVGGDFYDVFDTGGDWAMVIGDVCGKGPEAAAVTAIARSTIRSVAMDLRHPSQVIRKLNEAMFHQALDEQFCTLAYARVVPTARGLRLAVCRGGHTAPLIRRANGTVEPIGLPGPLVGIFDDIRVWEETALLEPGDAIVMYTDGVTEARQGTDQFGDERLIRIVETCDASSAESIAAAVETAVLEYCGEPTDDTAVLVLRVRDTSDHSPGSAKTMPRSSMT